ncbi:sodium-independent sulfate anion transporter-like isoform X2 [Aethina tumida]|uniref:sodium-independent sulfate anion transporter-like isoform X2 n=1 Tax=Aethina tumida TaxID=116153 RepID=UPI0021493773|nr:sodium-independent sulfate anion transporter-like isoform X2 [Aethina tumida]
MTAHQNGSKIKKLVKKRVPILEWLPKYTKGDILADFIAGLTVGLTMMPQSIAYAGLAGLPPQYGLYTAFIGSFTYIFFGTIKEVSIGPTSLMAIITCSYVDGLPIECMILLTFLAGCVELLMGFLKLGFLVDFISPPITSGFTSASALIIILAQMKHLLGIKIKTHDFLQTVVQVFQKVGETRWPDALLGISCIVFLFAVKKLSQMRTKNKRTKKVLWFLGISKNCIAVLITSVIAMYLIKQTGKSPFYLTGSVPQGLPTFGFPSFTATINNQTVGFTGMVHSLGVGVIVLPFVAVLANVAIAKSYASDVVVDATQEMMTLGLCNIFGSCVQAMPSCGAFTRSAVASNSDVRTPLQGLYSASVIILALSLLTPYFYYIPKATLAAVLITAGSSLVDYEILPVLWKTSKFDLVMTLFTFIVSIVFGVEIAIVIGAGINLISLLKLWSRPAILVEPRNLDKGDQYLYIKPELGLYYPAGDYLCEFIKKEYRRYSQVPMVLDCENVLRIDYAGVKAIQILLNTYNENSLQLVLANVDVDILKTLKQVIKEKDLYICDNIRDISYKTFNVTNNEEVIPLMNCDEKDSLNRGNSERKMSLYDNVE